MKHIVIAIAAVTVFLFVHANIDCSSNIVVAPTTTTTGTTTGTSTSGSTSTSTSTTPVCWYEFENNYNDSIGSNPGTGTAIFVATGHPGSCLDFSTASTYFQAPAADVFRPSGSFSIYMYVKVHASPGEGMFYVLYDQLDGGAPAMNMLTLQMSEPAVSGGQGTLDLYYGGSAIPLSANISYNHNSDSTDFIGYWHLVGIVYDYDTQYLNLYVDGVSQDSTIFAPGGISWSTSQGPALGVDSTLASSYFEGYIDEFKFFHEAVILN